MDIEFIILLFIIIIGFAGVFWFLSRQKKEPAVESEKLGALMERLSHLTEQSRELRQTMDTKLAETYRSHQEQFRQSASLIANITEKLTKLDETNRQVVNFSSQLQNLQDILKNPKQRGVLGEYYLETVLKNVLPPNSFAMQYKLGTDEKTGQELIVDAAVFIKDKIIPVDSKFSLENYERILNTTDAAERERLEKLFKQDLKTRIDETSKYIKPAAGTMDFAFMFIPSEAIYYDLLVNRVGAVQVSTQDLIEYAFKDRHVIIVSPTSFLAYLQTVLQGLRALQIEESAKEIMKNVGVLQKHLANYENYVAKLGAHLGTAVNTYNTGYKELKKIDKDIYRITGSSMKIEPTVLERPSVDIDEKV